MNHYVNIMNSFEEKGKDDIPTDEELLIFSESEDEEISVNGPTDESGEFDEEDVALELGSELTEESYDYSDDEKNN